MPQQPPGYVSPYQGMGGQINSMQRFEEMQKQAAAAGQPNTLPPQGMPQPQAPAQPGILQGLMNALQGYFKPQTAGQAGPPMQTTPDPNEVLNKMRATTAQAAQIR
jgi:hypothetical protein